MLAGCPSEVRPGSIEHPDERPRIHLTNGPSASREADVRESRQSVMTRKNARPHGGRLKAAGGQAVHRRPGGGHAPQGRRPIMWRGALTQGEHQADHHRP
ncbi:hypothetical protein TNCT1_56310 [Streptomyces sp. 1-11]|nr:hypothetical protein TNCT1_56310 [Streptomyces sp. 1-11]